MSVTTRTATLTDFLLARIAEDEGYVVRNGDCRCEDPERFGPAQPDCADRLAQECEAKRRIVEACSEVVAVPQEWVTADSDYTLAWYMLRLLALPYAAHPDYQESWRT